MVEPVITTTILLTALATKAVEKLTELMVEDGWENKSSLGKFLKDSIFGGDLTTLNLLAENPQNEKTQGKIEYAIEERLKKDPVLEAELKKILDEMPESTNKISLKGTAGRDNLMTVGNDNMQGNNNQRAGGNIINQEKKTSS